MPSTTWCGSRVRCAWAAAVSDAPCGALLDPRLPAEQSRHYLCVAFGRLLRNLGEWPEEQFVSGALLLAVRRGRLGGAASVAAG